MWTRFASHLYVRIWLAVVATVVVLAFLVGAAWQLSTDPPQLPIREVLVHNSAGEVIGTAQTKAGRKRGEDMEFDLVTRDGQVLSLLLPRPQRPPSSVWTRPPFGFGWMLGVVALAVALGTYPIVRRLTQRLEALQRGVEQWGDGDLSTRVSVRGGSDEVAFLADRFNHAAERIETLMETQKSLLVSHKSLLANASHELRSPLARIRMGLELMTHQAPTPGTNLTSLSPEGAELAGGGPSPHSPPPERSHEIRNELFRSINELDQLIDEILLASRLDARQADAEPFETVDLTGLAAEECARVQAELDTAAQSHSLTVQGSARLLRRLIRNLLENARRYGTGEISLDLSQSGVGTQERVVIRVNDRGPGVPPSQRERIFEPFYRLPGASEREGGVGLGLALVKSITERHGGTVRCEDRPGGGASFVVELPVRAAA